MTTTTHREYKSFSIRPGATRESIVTAFDDATLTIQDRAAEQSAEVLWDMMHLSFTEEEREELMSLSGEDLASSTRPPNIELSVPFAVTS